MTTLITIAVTNALTAVPLALLAWIIGRTIRRPALTHALWIIVLMKMVTPPLFQFPVAVSLPSESQVIYQEPAIAHPITVAKEHAVTGSAIESIDSSAIRLEPQPVDPTSFASAIETASDDSLPTALIATRSFSSMANDLLIAPLFLIALKFRQAFAGWGTLLLSVWIVGSLITFGIQILLVIRFGKRVAAAGICDEDLQRQADRLARSMSLRSCPEVWIVPATISPMLWSCGARTRILFPQELMSRLNAESRETLVIHELAHYGRGDHWVRCLEFLATGLFWWHPVLWWARHQIEEVEEECCDNWVVSHIQQNPRRYAEALLDTIDFLCGVPSTVPPMASGLGNASFLRRRLTNIMRGASPKAMSHRLRATIAILLAILLPFQPLLFGSVSSVSKSLPNVLDMVGSAGNRDNIVIILDQSASRGSDIPTPDAVESVENADQQPSMQERVNPSAVTPKARVLRGEQVWSNAVSPDGRFVIRATTGRRVLLTDLQSDRETDLSEHGISAVSFTPDGRQIAAVTNSGQVLRLDAIKGGLVKVLYTHPSPLRTVSVSPEGDSVAVGGRDGSVNVIDLASGEITLQLPMQDLPVNCVRFSPDGARVAVAVGDWNTNDQGHVRLINLRTGTTEVIKCDTTPGALTFVSNDELIIGQWNGHATLWNLIQHKAVGAADADKAVIAAVAFSPDNPQLREIAFVSLKSAEDLFGDLFGK